MGKDEQQRAFWIGDSRIERGRSVLASRTNEPQSGPATPTQTADSVTFIMTFPSHELALNHPFRQLFTVIR